MPKKCIDGQIIACKKLYCDCGITQNLYRHSLMCGVPLSILSLNLCVVSPPQDKCAVSPLKWDVCCPPSLLTFCELVCGVPLLQWNVLCPPPPNYFTTKIVCCVPPYLFMCYSKLVFEFVNLTSQSQLVSSSVALPAKCLCSFELGNFVKILDPPQIMKNKFSWPPPLLGKFPNF